MRLLGLLRPHFLLIVGELNGVVIELNAGATDAMHTERDMVIVPGAGHLFEEPHTLDQMAEFTQTSSASTLGAQP